MKPRVTAKFGENWLLESQRKVIWYCAPEFAPWFWLVITLSMCWAVSHDAIMSCAIYKRQWDRKWWLMVTR